MIFIMLVKTNMEAPTDLELSQYERRLREVKFVHSFHSNDPFDEVKHLNQIIEARESSITRLLKGLNLNSSIMNHAEVEVWKKAYTAQRNDLLLHRNIAAFKFPSDFPADI